MSTHVDTSNLDIRFHLHLVKHGIINLHVLAISVYKWHIGQVISDRAARAFDVLWPSQRDIIIGVLMNSKRRWKAPFLVWERRFQNAAKLYFIWILCGAYQLDLFFQDVYCELANDKFHTQLSSLISYLRRQKNLILDMWKKAPKLFDTCWVSMSKVGKWFKTNRIAIINYLAQKSSVCALSHESWILLLVISEYFSLATKCFKSLYEHQVTVSMQRSSLLPLQMSPLRTVGGKVPLSESDELVLDTNSDAVMLDCRSLSVSMLQTEEFLINLKSVLTSRIPLFDEQVIGQHVNDITKLYLSTVAGVVDIVAERDEANESNDMSRTPVVSSQLVKCHSLSSATSLPLNRSTGRQLGGQRQTSMQWRRSTAT